MAIVTSATKFFPTAQEGFATTTSGSVSSGAVTVGLASVNGYNNGEVVTLVIDPTDADKKQVFTGVVDTSGTQITGVVWTEGTNQDHTTGATVVDYETATAWALYSKGLLVDHSQAGAHEIATNYDPSNPTLETQKWVGVASAVNELTVTNSATGNPVLLSATGGDSNIDLKLVPKGTGRVIMNGAGAASNDTVLTSQTTASTSYTDLATVGPAVTVTVGSSGMALVIVSGRIGNNTTGKASFISWVASGANTIAVSDSQAFDNVFVSAYSTNGSRARLLTGLTPGSTVFTAKYRVDGGTGDFAERDLAVIPL